jgi:cytoskeleton protein RodZ
MMSLEVRVEFMTSIGETLRRERQKRNLQLDQVSRELKISTRFLEAIEQENFDRLPGGVFAKSFVRQYARMLDLDEEEAAAEVQRTLTPTSLPEFTRAAGSTPAAPQIGEFAPRVDSISSRPFASGSWLPALALVVAVMLGCSLVYGWWQRDHRRQPAATTAKPNLAATAQASNTAPQIPAPSPEAASPTQEAPAPPAAAESTGTPVIAAAPTTPELRPSGAVKVEITTADEPVWVLARTDGKFAFSGTIDPNQTRTVDADGIVLLRLGNAGGVTISVNGKPIPTIGPKGQVRTVQLTSGGFQIVAPPKPSAPPPGTPL